MDLTILTFLITIYIVIVWIIVFSVLHDERFNVLDKRFIIGFLLIPPIGILLFFLIRQIRRKQHPNKKKRRSRRPVFHGTYDGGHNKPKQ